MKLKYGKKSVKLPLPNKNILKILNSEEQEVLLNPEDKLSDLLKNPMGSLSLKKLIQQKGAKKILIIVNDITRPMPYEIILLPLLDELKKNRNKKRKYNFYNCNWNTPKQLPRGNKGNVWERYIFQL